jgi:hypothetical protein
VAGVCLRKRSKANNAHHKYLRRGMDRSVQ